jgi:hypothetical protein
LRVKYSPDFAAAFEDLPEATKEKFKLIDRKVMLGNLSDFDKMGWAHFVDIDEDWTAMGRVKEDGELFYWLLLASPQSKPMIL